MLLWSGVARPAGGLAKAQHQSAWRSQAADAARTPPMAAGERALQLVAQGGTGTLQLAGKVMKVQHHPYRSIRTRVSKLKLAATLSSSCCPACPPHPTTPPSADPTRLPDPTRPDTRPDANPVL